MQGGFPNPGVLPGTGKGPTVKHNLGDSFPQHPVTTEIHVKAFRTCHLLSPGRPLPTTRYFYCYFLLFPEQWKAPRPILVCFVFCFAFIFFLPQSMPNLSRKKTKREFNYIFKFLLESSERSQKCASLRWHT